MQIGRWVSQTKPANLGYESISKGCYHLHPPSHLFLLLSPEADVHFTVLWRWKAVLSNQPYMQFSLRGENIGCRGMWANYTIKIILLTKMFIKSVSTICECSVCRMSVLCQLTVFVEISKVCRWRVLSCLIKIQTKQLKRITLQHRS